MSAKNNYMMQDTLFSLDSLYSHKFNFFKNSTDLGKLYQSIPWDAICVKLKIPKNKRGLIKLLDGRGMVALMILKHYTCLSDQKLLNRLNTDYAMQYFCGIELKNGKLIKDNAFVSCVRSYISKHFDLDSIQTLFINHWKGEIQEPDSITMDATCYESYVRYPTDVKLLNESLEFIYAKQIIPICELHKILKPSLAKYEALKKDILSYSKKKKRSKKATKKLIFRLLQLVKHGLKSLENIVNRNEIATANIDRSRIILIEKVLEQQTFHYHNPQESVKDRIVSLAKPYVRPIVRGKENKPVEFGVKVNKIQVGGISIIQKASFDAFNECNTLKASVEKSEMLLSKVTKLGADQIYATNENRKFLTKENVITNFARKGPKMAIDPNSEIRKQLGTIRATSLEGSFGNEKNHYGLSKIKAKSKSNELTWLYFGIITSNVVKISEQREKLKKENIKQEKLKKAA